MENLSVEVFSKNNCPYCVKVKDFLNERGIEFKEYNIEHEPEYKTSFDDYGFKTVPQIFYKGEHVGDSKGVVLLYDMMREDGFKRQSCRLLEPKVTYTFDYPEAIEFADTQNDIFWLHSEIAVEKDLQDMRVNMTEAEQHGVITTLKLFTLYELFAGSEYWSDRVMKTFPRPDIQRMANCFSFFELNVHAPFYNKLNEVLNLNTDDFYNSYVEDPVLKERMEFIDNVVNNEDVALSLGVFSMIEGAILYSSFAFLKHFQAQGKNKLLNVVRGINFSVRDENLHSEGGSWLFRTYLREMEYSEKQKEELYGKIKQAASKVYEHECKIIDMIFEKGKIEGITDVQMKHFVESRINLCLQNLGTTNLFKVKYNPIADWFYKNINSVNFHDFFSGIGNSYNRDWDEKRFTW